MALIFAYALRLIDAQGTRDDLVARAARENAIEQAALRKTIPFTAGDI
jgi:hypothetical protein